jgi:hypothetical protein
MTLTRSGATARALLSPANVFAGVACSIVTVARLRQNVRPLVSNLSGLLLCVGRVGNERSPPPHLPGSDRASTLSFSFRPWIGGRQWIEVGKYRILRIQQVISSCPTSSSRDTATIIFMRASQLPCMIGDCTLSLYIFLFQNLHSTPRKQAGTRQSNAVQCRCSPSEERGKEQVVKKCVRAE